MKGGMMHGGENHQNTGSVVLLRYLLYSRCYNLSGDFNSTLSRISVFCVSLKDFISWEIKQYHIHRCQHQPRNCMQNMLQREQQNNDA